MRVSIVIPVFNEKKTIREIIKRVINKKQIYQVIIVDDGSTDGTDKILKNYKNKRKVEVFLHKQNKGKGAAVRTALAYIKGDVAIIQDADLEYDPENYEELLAPIKKGVADVVFGSRLSSGKPRRALFFWHMLGNKILTFFTNVLYNTTLTDMETGYKVFTKEVLQTLDLCSNKFDIEPEITAKILKQGWRLYEVPISYYGRLYEEGKKISFKDALIAFWTLLKYRFCK